MALRVTGTLLTLASTPYSVDGSSGVSHKARVLTGRAEFEDVKVPEGLLGMIPQPIPDEGVPVDWAVNISYGKVKLVGNFAPAKPLRNAG
jgi:hypothetical protein